MSAYSADSPSQEQKTPKKRSRDPIWDNFTEVYDLGELKMKCNQCQQIVTKHKTSLTSHWEHRHKDDQQPAKKIRASLATGSTEPNEKHKKIQSALAAALSIPAMSINIFLHPLMCRLFRFMSPNAVIPSSFATLKSLLLNQLVIVQNRVKNPVGNLSQRFSLTCDVWTDSGMMNAYLARNQNEIVQAGARSWIRESLDKVRDASSSGIDPLKWWANLMNTSVKQIAIFAIDVLSIPATSAPIERVFSQAGLACAKHRNRTSFNLLNAQLIVYCNMFLEIVE
uniref:BED-type domain-containing protein n=2 Tax=Ditylenchus dipsaci TaxID=166011 RepID=A0A915DQW7_9BILA